MSREALDPEGRTMRERGFTNHAGIGAALLGGLWLAIYLPRLQPVLRMGGWSAGLALVAIALGVLGGPLCLLLVEGDEMFGILGLGMALLAGWTAARIGRLMGVPPSVVEGLRLGGAALGPVLLFGCFHVLARASQNRRS